MSVPSFKYNPAVDGLRAVAVLFVMLFHSFAPVAFGGFMGVDVFFVISGFLITSLLIDEEKRTDNIDFLAFFKRRLRRLMPALACFAAFYCLLAPVAWPEPGFFTHIRDALMALFYISDITITAADMPKYLRHTWSLAVEMQYYILWPFVFMLLLKKMERRRAFYCLLAAYVVLSLWRYVSFGIFGWDATYYRPDARLSGLILGGALAFFISEGRSFRHGVPLAWIFTLLATAVMMTTRWGTLSALTVGCTVVELAAFFVIAQTFMEKTSVITKALSHPGMVYMGRISYSLYLYHYPVIFYLRDNFAWKDTVLIGFTITFIAAAASFATVERFALSPERRNRL